MDVSSGFLAMTILITCVSRGGNARAEYGVCLTILIAFCFRQCLPVVDEIRRRSLILFNPVFGTIHL